MLELRNIKTPEAFERRYKTVRVRPDLYFASLYIFIPNAGRGTTLEIEAALTCSCRRKIRTIRDKLFVLCCPRAVSLLREAKCFPRAVFTQIEYEAPPAENPELKRLEFLRAAKVTSFRDFKFAKMRCELDLTLLCYKLDSQRFVHPQDLDPVIDSILSRFSHIEKRLRSSLCATLVKRPTELEGNAAVAFTLLTANNALLDRVLRFDVCAYNCSMQEVAEILRDAQFDVLYDTGCAYVIGAITGQDDYKRASRIVGCIWKELETYTKVKSAQVCYYQCFAPQDDFRANVAYPESETINTIKFVLEKPQNAKILENLSINGRKLRVLFFE